MSISSEPEREPDSRNSDGGHRGKQQQQIAIMDGDILNTEFPVYSSSDDGAASSEPDDEIAQAQEKLKLIRKENKRLMKKKKLEQIARETEEAEKSFEKMKKSKQQQQKRKGKKVTVESLRDMDDVVVKVDKLMDKEMKLGKSKKKVVYSSSSDLDSSTSSDSEDDSSSSNPSSDSDSEPENKKKGKKREVEKTKKKEKKRRSSKSKRLTSDVKYPQKWPQSLLTLHFVNKGKKYEDLTISEFCAGYASILEMTSKSKMGHRIAHLKELMYLSTKYQWKCVLIYHAACLLEIERGNSKWGDSFQSLQSTTLAGGFLNANRSGNGGSGSTGRTSGAGGQNPGKTEGQGTVFCRGYQRGTCKNSQDHSGYFNGESRTLRHICAKCWLKSRAIATHPETSDNCPLKDEP